MRRIVQPSRVLFVERNRGRSLFLFAVALILLLMAQTAWERRADDSTALPFAGSWIAAAGGLAAVAILHLLRQRAFVVDRSTSSLRILERPLFRLRTTTLPLKSLRVRLDRSIVLIVWRGSYERTTSRLWVETHEGDVLFLDDIRGREAVSLGHRLASDLGCRLTINDLNEW